jgi:hypothetical protein
LQLTIGVSKQSRKYLGQVSHKRTQLNLGAFSDPKLPHDKPKGGLFCMTFEQHNNRVKALLGPNHWTNRYLKGLSPSLDPESALPTPEANEGTQLCLLTEVQQGPKRRTPQDGQTITLQEFLDSYRTPISDAYALSRRGNPGDPRSQTLEQVIQRLREIPWANQIRIRFDSRATNPEYDAATSTITINPNASAQRQIESFVHEAYHATHAGLHALYNNGVVTEQEFVRIYMNNEVQAMLAEARVHTELGHGPPPVRFYYRRPDGTQAHIDIASYVAQHGENALRAFLTTAQPIGQNAQPYGNHYASFYAAYRQNFNQNRPTVLQFIQRWVNSGHQAQDL